MKREPGLSDRTIAALVLLVLAGVIAVAYLTYLEIFIIEAICVWCAAFGLTVVAGWIVAAAVAMRGSVRA